MALADYFHRAAVAAAQVLQGYDEDAIRERLDQADVGISWSEAAGQSREGQCSLDLLVRLLARLYPSLTISAPSEKQRGPLVDLARRINPLIDIHLDREPRVLVAVGDVAATTGLTIRIGSDAWTAYVGADSAPPVGESTVPFGAGAAAALAASNVFRALFLAEGDQTLDHDLELSTWNGVVGSTPGPSAHDVNLGDRNVLVGAGAIGNAVLWALARANICGQLAVVDAEAVELSNVQRYVLTTPNDVGRSKVQLAVESFVISQLDVQAFPVDWATFVEANGYSWERAIVALDTARDRRAVQAALPRWIANAWTQPGDLGVSIHPWTETGACLSCLYLPEGPVPSEDKLIAEALGMARPDRELQIRKALYANAPAPHELLEEAARNLGVRIDDVELFASRPLRELYTEGICGGLVLPLDRVGQLQQGVHVPIAHQSALAGVLLAAAVVADAAGAGPNTTRVTRMNVLRPVLGLLTQPAQKDPRGICICQDEDFRTGYSRKYGR